MNEKIEYDVTYFMADGDIIVFNVTETSAEKALMYVNQVFEDEIEYVAIIDKFCNGWTIKPEDIKKVTLRQNI